MVRLFRIQGIDLGRSRGDKITNIRCFPVLAAIHYIRQKEQNGLGDAIRALAKELGEDADVLLAMAGKVSSDLLEIIRRHVE